MLVWGPHHFTTSIVPQPLNNVYWLLSAKKIMKMWKWMTPEAEAHVNEVIESFVNSGIPPLDPELYYIVIFLFRDSYVSASGVPYSLDASNLPKLPEDAIASKSGVDDKRNWVVVSIKEDSSFPSISASLFGYSQQPGLTELHDAIGCLLNK